MLKKDNKQHTFKVTVSQSQGASIQWAILWIYIVYAWTRITNYVMRREDSIHPVECYSHNNTDEPQVHCVKWKKPDSKGYLLFDSIDGILEKVGLWKTDPWFSGLEGRVCGYGTVLHHSCGDTTLCTYPNPTNCIQQRVTFTVHCLSQQVGWGDPK